jgi:DNA-binding transcriptional ArsR family regulator
MKAKDFDENVHWVTSPGAAAVLTNTREWNLLIILINQEASLSELAHEMRLSLPALSYRLKKLLKLGLVKVARTEKRKGSPIKYYRATATHFYVPFEATTFQSLTDLLAFTMAPFERRISREMARLLLEAAKGWGLNFFASPQGGFNITFSPVPERADTFLKQSLQLSFPAVHDKVLMLNLDFDTAKALQRDLQEVYERYHQQLRGQQSYLLRIALVPLQD